MVWVDAILQAEGVALHFAGALDLGQVVPTERGLEQGLGGIGPFSPALGGIRTHHPTTCRRARIWVKDRDCHDCNLCPGPDNCQ